ncbi:MAG: tetratricopeptide repeat protein [Acidobacteriaceae bacterium]|nr:tetratricopeptide repeat protein [Acidobacteriaceae bacterium]
MLFGQNTFQATLTVSVTLVLAFVVTGFASTAYHRERTKLAAAHFARGQALEIHGELEPALEEYRKALLFSPDKTEYRLSLATALLEAGRLDEAQSHLEQLAQEDPTSGQINLLLGRLAVQQHKLKQAVDFYQRGVYEYWPESEFPQRRQARWELAALLSKTGDRTGFIAELMQLYANLPMQDVAQKLKVGYLLLANGATSEASRIFQDLVKQAPQNAEARRGLGEVYFSYGDYVSARHEFQRALRLNPSDQETIQALNLANDVIDMDPALPYITGFEQVRRSRNLLSRVIKDIEECNQGSGAAAQRLQNARDLLSKQVKGDDPAYAMQTAAAQVWAERNTVCGNAVPQDRALDTVLTRIGHE